MNNKGLEKITYWRAP